jgi:hypothetical protein
VNGIMLVFALIGIWGVYWETWARAFGLKTKYDCSRYPYFLFGLCQPLIMVVLITVCYVVLSSVRWNPGMIETMVE